VKQIIFTKLGMRKGKKRIWLEGNKLKKAGIDSGDRYRVESDPETRCLTLIIDADGTHLVSGKKSRAETVLPVIDINNSDLDDIFGDVERLKATVYADRIVIRIHPGERDRLERIDRLRSKLAAGAALELGSLSTGLGVMDHALHQGFQRAGVPVHHAFGVEIEPQYLEASLANNPIWDNNSIAVTGPMQDLSEGDLPRVELLAAGIPCTGASKSGRSKNKLKHAEEHETAGHLFFHFLNIVRWTNPACLIIENVSEYLTTTSMTVIRSVLQEWGYDVHERVVDGNTFGALEGRKRMVVVGMTRGIGFDVEAVVPVRQKEAVLADVLDPVSADDPSWNEYPYLVEKEKRDIAAGKGFRMCRLTPDVASVNTIVRNYAKIQSTAPLLNHPSNPALMRLFTPAEHARIKTVPTSLIEGFSKTLAHQLLGQSVVHAAFVAVGQAIAHTLSRWVHGVPAFTVTPQVEPVTAAATLAPVHDTEQMSLL